MLRPRALRAAAIAGISLATLLAPAATRPPGTHLPHVYPLPQHAPGLRIPEAHPESALQQDTAPL